MRHKQFTHLRRTLSAQIVNVSHLGLLIKPLTHCNQLFVLAIGHIALDQSVLAVRCLIVVAFARLNESLSSQLVGWSDCSTIRKLSALTIESK